MISQSEEIPFLSSSICLIFFILLFSLPSSYSSSFFFSSLIFPFFHQIFCSFHLTTIDSIHHHSLTTSSLLKPFHKDVTNPWTTYLELFFCSSSISLINRRHHKQYQAAPTSWADFWNYFSYFGTDFGNYFSTFQEIFGSIKSVFDYISIGAWFFGFLLNFKHNLFGIFLEKIARVLRKLLKF